MSRFPVIGRRYMRVFDGGRVFRVGRLSELEDASEVFIDALFPELYEEVLELLRRGVKVYLLRDATKLKKLRIENNLKKSDESDAMLLARIPKEMFRPLMVEEIEIKIKVEPLIRKYRWIARWKKTLKKFIKEGFDYNFREAVRLMRVDEAKLSREIIRQVSGLPIYGEVYKKACEILGVKKSIELAILAIELPLYLRLTKLKKILGLIPNKNEGKYNHKLRAHVANLATSLYLSVKKGVSVSDKVAEIVKHLPRRQAILRLELMALKALKAAYSTTTNPITGG